MKKNCKLQPDHCNLKRGFTIIETLVALSIFTVSILGLLTVTAQGVSDTNFSKNKFIASYLAQEGIEMVRNMRDTSILSGNTWTNSFHQGSPYNLNECYPTGVSAGCDINSKTLIAFQCPISPGICSNLGYDLVSGFYSSGPFDQSSKDSGFNRLITLKDVNDHEVQVTTTVYWTQGASTKSVTLTENIFDWIMIAPATP